jgi:hypothetical protein
MVMDTRKGLQLGWGPTEEAFENFCELVEAKNPKGILPL